MFEKICMSSVFRYAVTTNMYPMTSNYMWFAFMLWDVSYLCDRFAKQAHELYEHGKLLSAFMRTDLVFYI